MRRVYKTHTFYKECRQIFESQSPRRSEKVRNVLNIPPRQTHVLRPNNCGQPRHNMIIPSEQTLELSNDYNYDTITDNDFEDENTEHPIPVATDITLV